MQTLEHLKMSKWASKCLSSSRMFFLQTTLVKVTKYPPLNFDMTESTYNLGLDFSAALDTLDYE